jgi:hypothetical protein
MTLKTTLEQIDALDREPATTAEKMNYPFRFREVGPDLVHDARRAHWYRLLAWGLHSGRMYSAGPSAVYVQVEPGSGVVRVIGITKDKDGLPVRTPELESALRKAMEEATAK